jgi:hypothetical protein
MDANALQIRDAVIREQPWFKPGGDVGKKTLVTFYVSQHGPFTLEYTDERPSPTKVKADMDAKVLELRTILS